MNSPYGVEAESLHVVDGVLHGVPVMLHELLCTPHDERKIDLIDGYLNTQLLRVFDLVHHVRWVNHHLGGDAPHIEACSPKLSHLDERNGFPVFDRGVRDHHTASASHH